MTNDELIAMAVIAAILCALLLLQSPYGFSLDLRGLR